MDDCLNDADRDALSDPGAIWPGDPEQTLTKVELDRVMEHFSASVKVGDPALCFSLKNQFQIFVVTALKEGYLERDGNLKKVPKPSTRISREIFQLRKTSEKLYEQLAKLDPVTKTWIGQNFETVGRKDESKDRDRFRDLDDRLFELAQDISLTARSADGIASTGPNFMALRLMIENLAQCWEVAYGKPPTTDKGRGRRDEAFLALCQEVAGIAHTRLKAKDGRISSLNLAGLVDDVLKIRSSQTAGKPREK